MGLKAALCSLALFLSLIPAKALNFSASQPKQKIVSKIKQKPKLARITFYNKHEDKYGNRIACSSRRRAVRGRTAAAESQFPFGTIVKIPWLTKLLGTGRYVVEDRGSAVERRKASRGTVPVFDLYVETKKEMKRLAAIVPAYLPYEIQ